MPTAIDMKVYILACGALGMERRLLLPSANGGSASRDSEWIECPVHAVLIEHPQGLMLWDCAVSPGWQSEWGEEQKRLMPYEFASTADHLTSQLANLGYSPADIDLLVLSHFHVDHAGNVGLFRDSATRLIVQEAELASVVADSNYPARAAILACEFTTIRGDHEILPGVRVLSTPGHTPGLMSLVVDLANDGPIIFASDAIYLSESIETRNFGAAVWNGEEWASSLDRVVGLAEKLNARLVFGHDAEQRRTLRHSPDFYS
ncbi:MAG: N-acyl homoserine lactonase [Subtercola sp.]|nr:N-acyl homoserine lactonase [Subtercola sp.]